MEHQSILSNKVSGAKTQSKMIFCKKKRWNKSHKTLTHANANADTQNYNHISVLKLDEISQNSRAWKLKISYWNNPNKIIWLVVSFMQNISPYILGSDGWQRQLYVEVLIILNT